jgi:threonine dehydratase
MSVEHQKSFVDGIGGKSVMADMWPLSSRLLAGSRVVSVAQAAAAVRLLAERNRVVAEGAGAVPVAAALAADDLPAPIVCIVSGGNIDAAKLATILGGGVPA